MTATVTIAIPVRNEEHRLARTLDSVVAQTSSSTIVEILVADGRSSDRTREIAGRVPGVRLIDNPGVRQAAGLNAILREASGDVTVRVDGHCVLAPDYVERCLLALDRTGAAMVGGAMTPEGEGELGRAVGRAMASRLGAGPARFHVGGSAGWVDTVYLGAYWTRLAREMGGYAEDVGVNEDAELAIRMASQGGVWFDPTIMSSYTPRASVRAVATQFYWYGRSRAATVKKHPGSLSPRQLSAPALVVGLASRHRARVALAYAAVLAAGAWGARAEGASVAARVPFVMAAMHLSWGAGFLVGGAVAPPAGSRAAARIRGGFVVTAVEARPAPRVSVVVPTYNRADTLARLLGTLERCDAPVGGFEVVVVDDGSVDDTAAVVAKPSTLGIVYVRQQNAGAAATRNAGWRRARGDLIAFTDDDCVPTDTWLVELVEAMDRDGCDGAGGRIVPLVPGFVADFVQAERLVGHGGDADAVKYLVTANAMFTRTTLEAVGGFDERFPGAAGEDTDLTYRVQDRDLRLTMAGCGTVAHDHRTSWRGLFRTYYRHGRAWHTLSIAHPDRTGGTRSRILTPGYWVERYRYYRSEGAAVPTAAVFCALRGIGMACFVTGKAREAQDDRRRARR